MNKWHSKSDFEVLISKEGYSTVVAYLQVLHVRGKRILAGRMFSDSVVRALHRLMHCSDMETLGRGGIKFQLLIFLHLI